MDQKRESPTRRRAFSPGRPAPATIEPRGMPISRSRALIAFRGVRGALAATFADKTALKAAVLNCLSAVASGANRCATDTRCANPSSSRSGTAGCDDPGTSRSEYRPETSPPAAHNRQGSLGDGQSVGGFRRSGRSSVSASSRHRLRWTRVSLVVLALLAQIVAPGTLFAVAAGRTPISRPSGPFEDWRRRRAIRRVLATRQADRGRRHYKNLLQQQNLDRRRHDGDWGVVRRFTAVGLRTCSRATRPAISPPAGRRLPS